MQRILSLIALLLAFAAPLRAADVQATVMSASSQSRFYDSSGNAQPLKAGSMLRPGTRISTAAQGVCVLLLADGSRLTLGPNTELTLSEMSKEGDSFGNVFNLLKGLIRASVQKLTVGSKFEVQSSHGVAAVKGTIFECQSDDRGMEVRCSEGSVWLSDLRRERTTRINREERARAFREELQEKQHMTVEELRSFSSWADESLPKRSGDDCRCGYNALRPEQQAQVWGALRNALGETWTDITTLTREERQERWRERLHRVDDRRLAGDEAQVDFTLGKNMLDRTGRKVRFDEFLIRPAADKLQFLNYTKREDRTDLVNVVNTYNQALPRNLGEARDINQKVWYQTARPTWWVVSSSVVFANSANDSFAGSSWYYDPVRILNRWELPLDTVELRLNVPDISQPSVGGTLLESYTRVNSQISATPTRANGTTLVPGSYGGSITALQASTTDMRWSGGIGFVAFNSILNVAPTARLLSSAELGVGAGDLAWGERRSYADGTYVDLMSHAIDENGRVRNAAELLSHGLFNAYLDLAFRTYQEVSIRSNRFSGLGDIDIVSQMMWWFTITKRSDSL